MVKKATVAMSARGSAGWRRGERRGEEEGNGKVAHLLYNFERAVRAYPE